MNPAPRAASPARLLLLDVGNTHCHAALASPRRLLTHADWPTAHLADPRRARRHLNSLIQCAPLTGIALCSVVPRATRQVRALLRAGGLPTPRILRADTLHDLPLDYPRPATIGPDRLANALAARHHFGAPCVVVDFGTAVTFDIVNHRGAYVGGIIAPGLEALTDYLHDKTALLPRIRIREVHAAFGRSTEEAMLVGAVHGYRGLIRTLIHNLQAHLQSSDLPVIATGGYARLIARGVPEVSHVRPHLTLEGLRLFWHLPPR